MNALALKRTNGFALEELLIVVAVVGILAALAVTFLPRPGRHADRGRIRCHLNQKQIGTAFRVFASDNNDRYPLLAPTGSYIVPDSASVNQVNASSAAGWQVAQAMWNELQTPKVLLCPDDRERNNASQPAVPDFNGLAGNTNGISSFSLGFAGNQNRSVSYAFGVAADESRPEGVLVVDRNINNVGVAGGGIMRNVALTNTRAVMNGTRGPTQAVFLTGTPIHRLEGNLTYADGSVRQATSEVLRQAFENAAKVYGTTITNQNEMLFP